MRMLEILERIVAGNGAEKDLDLLEELAVTITETALCGLGKSAALPVMSTLKLFREEYLEHVVDKHCASHTCTAMRRFVISPERCKGCSKCAKNCPADAISGRSKNLMSSTTPDVSSAEHARVPVLSALYMLNGRRRTLK